MANLDVIIENENGEGIDTTPLKKEKGGSYDDGNAGDGNEQTGTFPTMSMAQGATFDERMEHKKNSLKASQEKENDYKMEALSQNEKIE